MTISCFGLKECENRCSPSFNLYNYLDNPIILTLSFLLPGRKLLCCKPAASACAADEQCLTWCFQQLPGCAANPQTWLHKPRLRNTILQTKRVCPTSSFYITVILLQHSNAGSLTGLLLSQSACTRSPLVSSAEYSGPPGSLILHFLFVSVLSE